MMLMLTGDLTNFRYGAGWHTAEKLTPAHDVLHFEYSHDVPEPPRCAVAQKGWWASDSEAFPAVLQVDTQLFRLRKARMIADYTPQFDTTTAEGLNKMKRTGFGGSSVAQSLILEDSPH